LLVSFVLFGAPEGHPTNESVARAFDNAAALLQGAARQVH